MNDEEARRIQMERRSFFSRQGARYKNEYKQSCSELLGIAEGMVCDGALNDAEIEFLERWLGKHDAAACEWPVDIVHARVKAALADGAVTEHERKHLLETLRQLVGGQLERLAESPKVAALALDAVDAVTIGGALFCLTGEFVYAPREKCEEVIVVRGGRVKKNVTRETTYLVVGGLGSEEWKHGSYGTKIVKAMEYKRKGCPILLVHEDSWAKACSAP